MVVATRVMPMMQNTSKNNGDVPEIERRAPHNKRHPTTKKHTPNTGAPHTPHKKERVKQHKTPRRNKEEAALRHVQHGNLGKKASKHTSSGVS